ncbi:MAG TPA: hypothetical protein VHM66_02465 [Solirubrobacterales bacterium]|jgi:hypothetical protein|nr:hypothetical protein [Solirubrobacterales bacterium]
MAQAGHNDPTTTLGIYARVIESGTDHGAALDNLVSGRYRAQAGAQTEIEGSATDSESAL